MQSNLDKQVAVRIAVKKRLDELKDIEAEQECSISQGSEDNFYIFLDKADITRCPHLCIMSSIQICAMWRNDQGDYLSLQFYDHGSVYFVWSEVDYSGFSHCSTGVLDVNDIVTSLRKNGWIRVLVD